MSKVLSALIGVSMLGVVGTADAAEPVTLTDVQMDKVTAGALSQDQISMIRGLEQQIQGLKALDGALPPSLLGLLSQAEQDLQRIATGTLSSGELMQLQNKWEGNLKTLQSGTLLR